MTDPLVPTALRFVTYANCALQIEEDSGASAAASALTALSVAKRLAVKCHQSGSSDTVAPAPRDIFFYMLRTIPYYDCSTKDYIQEWRSVPLGRPGPGVGVKKINVRPYSPPAKLKTAGANPPTAILDTPDRAESKLAVATVAGPGSGYELAVTSCTLARARLPRGFRARGIFPKKSLS